MDNLKLATRVWAVMGAVVLILATIVTGTAMVSARNRADYAAANEQNANKIRLAYQWAADSDTNVVRSYGVVVSMDAGVAVAFKDDIAQSNERIAQLQKQIEALPMTAADQAQITTIGALRVKLLDMNAQAALRKVTAKGDEFKAFLANDYRPAMLALQKGQLDFVRLQESESQATSEAFDARGRSAVLMSAAAVAALLVALLAGAAVLVRSICRPLLHANAIAARIARGDLTGDIDTTRGDELGDLMRSLHEMNQSLASMVSRVREGTHSMGHVSEEIAAGNNDLSARTEQTAANLEETASSMQELTSNVRQSADSAKQANQLAASAAQVAQRGGAVVGQVVSTMGEINTSSRKISDIISVIDGIAFQTNILALNAAVEAARAGEQGRGFAVVAAEVRSLAGRSAEAAKEIKLLINTSVEKVEGGAALVAQAGETMTEIVSSVQRVTDIMGEITAATSEQSDGIAQVNTAIGQLDQMTQQNAALVEQAAAAASSMKDQSHQLAGVVATFKLDAIAPVTNHHVAGPRPSLPKAPAPHKALAAPSKPLPIAKAPPVATAKAAPRSVPPPKAKGDDEWETF